MQRAWLSSLYIIFLCVIVGIGLFYTSVSNGFAAPTGDRPFFCRELKGGGSADEVMLLTLIIFLVPALIRLFRFNRRPGLWEAFVYLSCLLLASVALLVAGLDCASLIYTAFGVPDLWLATLLISIPVTAILMTVLRLKT